jgi:hypothetical protein
MMLSRCYPVRVLSPLTSNYEQETTMTTTNNIPLPAGAVLVAAFIALALALVPTGRDMVLCDPSPSPTVPYQVPGPSGPVLPANEVLPPICGVYMRACGFTYDPGTGTWGPSAG